MSESATPAVLQLLLTDTLAMWNMRGRVVAQGTQAVLVQAEGKAEIRVEPAAADGRPFRWSVRTGAGPARGCPSIVVVLTVLREALGVAVNPGLRISPVRSSQ
jgi:hypothetical protein